MRVTCSLRRVRGERTLAEVARAAEVSIPHLSQIERGIELPRDEWVEALERAYGAPAHEWYPPALLLQIERDEAA